jgi:hypothetical protein
MRPRVSGPAAAVAVVLAAASCDPVRSDAIAALGGEAPGVRQGPLHRPGQPCLLCHDGSIGAPEGFTVAGTVFVFSGDRTPVNGATVKLVDSTGSSFLALTNEEGNFYVLPSQWTPRYPMTVSVVRPGASPRGRTVTVMQTPIHTEGSCAGCHSDPASAGSPGHVCLELADGGTPP